MRLALYQPDMAPNVGAAIRLTACFGIGLDIIEPCGFPLTSRDIRRVAMDYNELAQITRHASWEAFHHSHIRQNGRLILMTTKGASSLWDFTFAPGDTLLMGQESSGVPDEVHKGVDARLVIPMTMAARSLNLVVSAGIALGEASRQMSLEAMSG